MVLNVAEFDFICQPWALASHDLSGADKTFNVRSEWTVEYRAESHRVRLRQLGGILPHLRPYGGGFKPAAGRGMHRDQVRGS